MSADFGPWVGVPKDRQMICAVEDCPEEGKRHACLYDGRLHHHGCIHYDCEAAKSTNHGLKFRKGWGLLCDGHYKVLEAAADRSGHKVE